MAAGSSWSDSLDKKAASQAKRLSVSLPWIRQHSGLELIRHADIVSGAGLAHLQHLMILSTVDSIGRLGYVDTGKEKGQIIGVLIACANVDLVEGLYVLWVSKPSLILAHARQIVIPPVVRNPRLKAIFVIKNH